MDRLKKRILYQPSKTIQVSEPIKEIEKKEPALKRDGSKLATWINKAELINKSALCKAAKIDRGNLDKYLSKGVIPEQHIAALVLILKNYGYAE